jgi:steroid 5-alpha reductase family enzyme
MNSQTGITIPRRSGSSAKLAAAADAKPLGWVAAVGLVIFAVGVGFETIGDAQLARFKADPANKGTIMDRGLWAWTRHPNYFGDSAVWWGLWVIAAEVWPAVLTVFSPVIMTYFLAFATGARLLESEMAKRPGYPEYMERTSMFFPRPPKRRQPA